MKKILSILFIALSMNVFAQPACITYTNSGLDLIQVPPNSALNFQGDFTISLKVRFDDVTFWNMLFCYDTYGGLEFSYTGNNSFTPQSLAFTTDGSSANVTHAQSWNPVNNQWYHVVLTKQGTTYTTYVDGTLLGTSNSGASIPDYSSYNLRIGNYLSPGLYFMGKMDEVSIWNIPLSQSFIGSTLSSPLQGNENGLILYFDMDTIGAGEGITVRNKALATGNSLNGITFGTSSSPYFLSTTSVLSFEHSGQQLSIYPNPVNDYLKIESDIPVERVEIYDNAGVLQKLELNVDCINVSALIPGIYNLKVLTKSAVSNGKFLKQ